MKLARSIQAAYQRDPLKFTIGSVVVVLLLWFVVTKVIEYIKRATVSINVANIEPGNISADFVASVPATVTKIHDVIGATVLDSSVLGSWFSVGDSEKTNMLNYLDGRTASEITLIYNEWNKRYQSTEGQTLTEFIADNAGSFTSDSSVSERLVGKMKALNLN